MSNFYQKLIQSTLIAGGIFATTPLVWATSFTINSGETVTTDQELIDNETGLIISGGILNTTGANTITVDGDNVAMTNNGTIMMLLTGRLQQALLPSPTTAQLPQVRLAPVPQLKL